jgi:hypothetical protein
MPPRYTTGHLESGSMTETRLNSCNTNKFAGHDFGHQPGIGNCDRQGFGWFGNK